MVSLKWHSQSRTHTHTKYSKNFFIAQQTFQRIKIHCLVIVHAEFTSHTKVKVYFDTFIKLCLGQSSAPSVRIKLGILFWKIISHFSLYPNFFLSLLHLPKRQTFARAEASRFCSQTVINKIARANSTTKIETLLRSKIQVNF